MTPRARSVVLAGALLLGCGERTPAAAPTPPVDPPAPAPELRVAEPTERGAGTLPPEGESELVLCAMDIGPDPDEALAFGDIAMRSDGTVIIASDGALLGFQVREGRDCLLRPHPDFGVEGRIAREGILAAEARLATDASGRLWIRAARTLVLELDGTIAEAEAAPLPSVAGTTALDRVREASGGSFAVLAHDAPTEVRLLDADGALLRAVHAGSTLDFALDVVAPGGGPARLTGLTSVRERVAYATFELSRGDAVETGVVRIAGL